MQTNEAKWRLIVVREQHKGKKKEGRGKDWGTRRTLKGLQWGQTKTDWADKTTASETSVIIMVSWNTHSIKEMIDLSNEYKRQELKLYTWADSIINAMTGSNKCALEEQVNTNLALNGSNTYIPIL